MPIHVMQRPYANQAFARNRAKKQDCVTKSLAVVLQDSSTGGWRYTCRLIEGLRSVRPDFKITAYLGRGVLSIDRTESPGGVLAAMGVTVKRMPPTRNLDRRSTGRFAVSLFRKVVGAFAYRRWIQGLKEHDISLFAWPFGVACPQTGKPIVFVPHDFNYTHFVGSFVDRPQNLSLMKEQHQHWIDNAHAVVSSEFIRCEFARAFPDSNQVPHVIPLSHLGTAGEMKQDAVHSHLEEMQIHGDYILCLNNLSAHKNLGQVLSGFHYVKQKFPKTRLIIAGHGTEGIQANSNVPWYVDHVDKDAQILSLGLRTDAEVKALIQGAKLVINGSVYEAGNGSGLDAWALGIPVAMSDIPAFTEHIRRLGVRAETFNPRCCYEIANAMLRILENPVLASFNATCSKEAMEKYTWLEVAERYSQFFDSLMSNIKELRMDTHSKVA